MIEITRKDVMKIKKNYVHDISFKSSSYIHMPFSHTQDVHCPQWIKIIPTGGGNNKIWKEK